MNLVSLGVKLALAWRLVPVLPALVGKMGGCISTFLETETLRSRVAQLERQLAAGGGGGAAAPGGGGSVSVVAAPAGGEVLFFPDPAMPCRNGKGCRRNNCTYAHGDTSLIRLLQWLGAAKQTLDVCVFSITCDELSEALLAAHNRGVRVRIISDNDQMATKGSDIERLKAAGMPVRWDKDAAHMHHKFMVLDSRFAMTGSFNWTRAGVLENQENVVILDAPGIAAKYAEKFESLWAAYA
ncbi:MT associated signaling phospholipase D [Raphidocelis subcapitata]|uniref:Mitochondrial cardiolipin hydrolase n=1 Tax=Raphidocelis subcapitata TaxID=307507 RepID=A0A2V0PPG5_9CHLO|nr:MT associated signaling phospholipase D [Raphidocelis subcapitata]|eukprot:GBF99930.1 MT associated signaling phospholipase D [Raphidocelis subcapitata]